MNMVVIILTNIIDSDNLGNVGNEHCMCMYIYSFKPTYNAGVIVLLVCGDVLLDVIALF